MKTMSITKVRNPELEKMRQLETVQSTLQINGLELLCKYITEETFEKLAYNASLAHTFFTRATKRLATKELPTDFEHFILILKDIKLLFSEMQEVEDPNALVMRLPGSRIEVNIRPYIHFLLKYTGHEMVEYLINQGTSAILKATEPGTLEDAEKVYDFLDELQLKISCIAHDYAD